MALLTANAASAHTLDGDANLVERLGHQFAGAHHLPVTLLLAAGIGLIVWRLRRKHHS
jgi:hypothetical protein